MTAPIRFDDLPDDPNKKRSTLSFDDLPERRKTSVKPPAIGDEGVVKPRMGAIRAIGTAIASGLLPEPLAGLGEQMRRPAGESEDVAYQRGMRGLAEKESQAQEAIGGLAYGGLNLAGGVVPALKIPGITARVAKDAPALAKALAAGKRVTGAGIAGGMEAAGRQGMSDNDMSPLGGAALGAGLTAGLEAGFPAAGALLRGASRIPIVGQGVAQMARALAEPVAEAVTQGRRSVSDYLAPKGGIAARAAGMIEPTDAIRVRREAAANLPGGVAGPTVATMDGGGGAARTAKTQAEVAAEQGKLRSKQATTARSKAEQEAKEELERVRQEESTLVALTKQKAGAIKEQGKSRAERLFGVAKTAEEEAKAIKAGATAAIKETEAATREQAKAALAAAEEEARSEAGQAIRGLRERQPRGTAKQLQESVRAKQLKEAEGHYEAVRAVGAPPDPDVSIYREIFDDPSLQSAYKGSAAAFPKEMRNAAPGTPALARPRMITINGEDVPEITLETMDQMRRRVLNPPYDPNKVGLSRSQRTQALNTIDRLEQRYLAGFGTDDAAEALRTARGAYREKFQILEAVQDGLNLGTVKAGKASGLLTQSRKELDEVAKRVENMTPKQRTAFQVGAREWFDRALQEGSADALAIAKKFSSEASQRRLALTYGDDAVEALRNFAPDVVGQRQGAAAARVREEGAKVGQQIASRAKADITPLQSRAERAAALAERAVSDKAARAEQVLGQRQADATQRVMETQRKTGATVRSAREEAGKAQDESSRLAEILSQARASATQAKQTPFGDLGRALGTSTQQQTFLQRLLPQMSPEQRSQSVEVLGSNIQRELQDMARDGKTPAEMIQRLKAFQQNDAVRALFSPQIDATIAQLQQRQSMVGPLRAALIGQAAGRM
jgi:hypothetical protein